MLCLGLVYGERLDRGGYGSQFGGLDHSGSVMLCIKTQKSGEIQGLSSEGIHALKLSLF